MDHVTNSGRIPVKYWLGDLEEGAFKQAENLSNLPFAFRHIAILPDSHQGYGMPIGSVLATDGVVIPNAVGVDIGCGMCAVQTSLTEIDTDTLKRILGGSKENPGGIRAMIPVGMRHQNKKEDESLMPERSGLPRDERDEDTSVVGLEYESARKQLGTMGGGNHFCEIQKGSDGHIWIMLHSGSRNLGFKVAKHYNELAKTLNAKWHTSVPKDFDLAFLPIHSREGQDYLAEMAYCVEFAEANRALMMSRIKEIFANVTGCTFVVEDIDIPHNYARMENHFGKDVMVHRKGATSARLGEIGLIPGSQGTKSYVVRGLGNPESFTSCSHGAGRRMSRTKAQETLNVEDEKRLLDDRGILHAIRGRSDLDEAPSAYKDIDVVMENQKDLVEILVELTPLAVVKG
jgi:tRNA-splicing ligase RtcB